MHLFVSRGSLDSLATSPTRGALEKPHAKTHAAARFLCSCWGLVALALFTTSCILFCWLRAVGDRVSLSRPSFLPPASTPARPKGALFRLCHPSLVKTSVDPDKVLLEAGGNCGEAQAATFRAALDAAGFSYKTALPDPLMVSKVLKAALSRNETQLQKLLTASQSTSGTNRKLGTLVRAFTHGFPTLASELEGALGSAAVQALKGCRLLTSCPKQPGVLTSTVMVTPVQHTSVHVLSDWPIYGLAGMKEQEVYYIGGDSLGLVRNAPPPTSRTHGQKGERVLDVCTGSGVQGLVAAWRGAAEVMLLDRNPRAVRFARYNSWLNRMGDKVRVVQGDVAKPPAAVTPGFDLLLANPPFVPTPPSDEDPAWYATGGSSGEDVLKSILKASMSLLGRNGTFAIVTHLPNPEKFNDDLCSGLDLIGFSGSVVYNWPSISAQDYAKQRARSDPGAGFEAQLRNLEANGIKDVSEGLIFGWRNRRYRGCGSFYSQSLPRLAAPVPATLPQRPCYWAEWGGRKQQSCPHLE